MIDAVKPWRDKKTMQYLYQERGYSQTKISEIIGCSTGAVSEWLEKLDLKREKKWKDKEVMHNLYIEERKNVHEVAQILNCSCKTVCDWLEKHGIEKRRGGQLQTPAHHYFNSQGYEHVRTQVDGDVKDISVHRLVAVAKHGIEVLTKDDLVVHHKNGVKWDNRPSNLKVMDESEHLSKHAMERDYKRDSRGRFA